MQGESTSEPDFAFYREVSTHGLGQMFADREAQAGSRNLGQPGIRAAIEGLENVFQLRGVDTHAAILNGNGNFFAGLCCLEARGDSNAAIDSAVLDGIGNQILEAAAYGLQITEDARKIGFDIFFDDPGL